MSRRVRTAVIGLGSIGPTHAQWCAGIPESELVAVCDLDEQRARSTADRYGASAYTDYRWVLERKDIDAVIVATPTFLHEPVMIEAAQAGKHVAVEKPLCLSLEQADAMIAAARAARVHTQYLENLCFSPCYRQAKEVIDAGGIGDVMFLRCCESSGGGVAAQQDAYGALHSGAPSGGEGQTLGSWYLDEAKSGGGALMSTGCHCIMYIRYLLDREPVTRVYAELSTVSHQQDGVEDAAYVTLRHRGGQIAWVDTSLVNALGTFDDRAEIYGTKGTIFLDIYRNSPIRVYSQPGYGTLGASMFGAIPRADQNWSYPLADERWALGYAAELRHFLGQILADTPPTITLEDGRATLAIVLAAYRSSSSGQAVLPEEIAGPPA